LPISSSDTIVPTFLIAAAGAAIPKNEGVSMKTLVCACAALMLMTGVAAAADKMMKEQDLIDLENAWSKAIVQHDVATISSIVADDWMGQNDSGKPEDKMHFLDEIKSGKMAAASMMNRDMHARIMHGTGIVQGMDDEKSMAKGKDTSGIYSWMDVFEMRDGKWQAVASQVTKVK
jgi:hypothetical protein